MPNIDLAQVYGEASREIRAELRAIDILGFDAGKAEGIRRKTRRLTLALDLAAKKWTDSALVSAYAREAGRTRVALEILGEKPRRQLMSKEIILRDRVLETLIKANISIRRTVDQFLGAALVGAQTARSVRIQEFDRRETLRWFQALGEEAVIEEISRGELGKRVIDYLLDLIGDEGFIEINGRFYNPRKYAKMVVRTEMGNAQSRATLDLCNQYENDLVQVSDHKTDCEICIEFEGNIYSISGHDPDYPMLEEEPEYHPNCRHRLLPTSREAIKAREIWG